jgi:hypothetical protein
VSGRLPAPAAALVLAVVLVPGAAALRFTDDSAEIAEPPGELLAAIPRFEEVERAEP